MSKVASSREELAVVVDGVGEHQGLTADLVKHQFVVRDLRIRAAASKLPRKQDLVDYLEELIRSTWDAAHGLSDFTANVSSTASWVRWWDMDLARGLDNLAKRQRDSMEAGLAHRALATMRPLAAFSAFDRTEDRVKELFVTTTNRVIGRVNLLVDSAEALLQGFQDIQDVLDHIKATAITEIGDLPTQSVLGALWVFLSLPDDREYAGMSHETLLRDLMQFYTTASGLMRDVIMALLRARAELEELDIEQVNPNICSRTAPSTSWRTRFEARQRDWAPAGRGSKQFDKAGGGVVCQSSRASVTGTPWMVTTEGNPGTRERHAQAA